MYLRFFQQCYLISQSFFKVCRKHGFLRTSNLAVRELFFDIVNGTETSIDLASESMILRGLEPAHAASNPLIFAEMIKHVSVEKKTSVFLDFGSGKGRAILLATQHGFTKMIGVEISSEFCAVARENFAKYLKYNPESFIEVYCADAGTFEVPIEVNIAFLYNPFGPEVILLMLDRIAESIACSPRKFYVIYLHPRFGDLFTQAGFSIVYRQGADGLVLLHNC
jgi:SAM-dependent methyltransferase